MKLQTLIQNQDELIFQSIKKQISPLTQASKALDTRQGRDEVYNRIVRLTSDILKINR